MNAFNLRPQSARISFVGLIALLLLAIVSFAHAQTATAPMTAPAVAAGAAPAGGGGLDPVQIKDIKEINSGDTAWMLTSAALVLLMTGPALALFYGGLVRRKNVLATMMQSFILMAVVSVLWAVVGYSLAFDVGNPFVGGFRFAFLREVGAG